MAAQTGAAIRLWSDCLGVVNKVKLLCRGQLKLAVNRPNSDLWTWLAASLDALGADNVQIYKVAAHRTLQSARTAIEVWQFFHNGFADNAARLANHARSEQFWTLWEEHVQQTQLAQTLSHQVQALHVAVGRRHVRGGRRAPSCYRWRAKDDQSVCATLHPWQLGTMCISQCVKVVWRDPHTAGGAMVFGASQWILRARCALGINHAVVPGLCHVLGQPRPLAGPKPMDRHRHETLPFGSWFFTEVAFAVVQADAQSCMEGGRL